MKPTFSEERTGLWIVKALSGVLIIAVLGLHLIVNHLVAEGGLMTFQDVIEYLSNPWVAAMEISFLILVVIHSLTGLRGIIMDVNLSGGTMRWIDRLLWIVGIGAVVYGIGLVFVITM